MTIVCNEDGRLFLLTREELLQHSIARSTVLSTLRTEPGQNVQLPFDRAAFQVWAASCCEDTVADAIAFPKGNIADTVANMKVCHCVACKTATWPVCA